MGDEKPDAATGSIGAVAAKYIEVTAGALYIAALDSSNRYVGLRVDKDGTAVIPVGQFDPLINLVVSQFGGFQSFQTAHVHKQVSFSRTVNGFTYQILAVGFPPHGFFSFGNGTSLVSVSAGQFQETSGRTWVAQSPDPAVGRFQFSLFIFNNQPSIIFTRQFVDSAGAARSASGQLTLPNSAELRFYLANPSSFPVSQDGLRVGEFSVDAVTQTGQLTCGAFATTTTKQYYELVITLAAAPTAQLNPVASVTNQSTGTQTCSFGSVVGTNGSSHTTLRIPIGYFVGAKQVYVRTVDQSSSGTFSPGWQGRCVNNGFGFGNYQEQTTFNYAFPEGSLSGMATCDEAAGRQGSGANVQNALDQRARDAIYFEPSSTIPLFFDGTLLFSNGAQGTSYVADASPVAEVFVAKSDLSLVIHRPLPGGIPQVVLPANITRLLAVLWL
jgi:hypothetical protein